MVNSEEQMPGTRKAGRRESIVRCTEVNRRDFRSRSDKKEMGGSDKAWHGKSNKCRPHKYSKNPITISSIKEILG